MIKSLYVKNFRSIKEQSFAFTFDEGKAPNGYRYGESGNIIFIDDGKDNRVVPMMAILGANASGKTSILRAIVQLCRVASCFQVNDLRQIFQPNKLIDCGSETTISAEYVHQGRCFKYSFSLGANGLSLERLFVDSELYFEVKAGLLVLGPPVELPAAYSLEMLQGRLTGECSDGKGVIVRSFMSLLGEKCKGVFPLVSLAYEAIVENTMALGIDRLAFLPESVKHLCSVAKIDETTALERIMSIVRSLDNDIVSVQIQEVKTDKRDPFYRNMMDRGFPMPDSVFQMSSRHTDAKGNMIPFDFLEEESAGTIRIAALVGEILATLEYGGVMFVDELELSLHPMLVKEVLKLFRSSDYNKRGAQLIFTTHMTDLLDDAILRMGEIGIVSKNKFRGSVFRRLVDLKNEGEDIRNVTNFRKQYLAGYYSGIPYPAL